MQNNQVQVFENREFGQLEILTINDKPYFPATECAEILGYSTPRHAVTRHCKGGMKRAVLTGGGKQEKTYIPEGDLYRLIIRSKLPAAEQFEQWVFDEVLPSIRKHGGYIVGELLDELLKSREMSNEYLNELKAEREYSTMKDTLLNDTIEFLEEIIPQAEYCETVLQCENCIPVTVIAKDYGMSAAAFNRLLRDVKIQYKVGGYYEHSGTWVLYSRHQGRGFTETKTFYKGKRAIVCTFWTQIGRKFVYEELKKYGILPEAEQSEVY